MYLSLALAALFAFFAGIAWKRMLMKDKLEWKTSIPFFIFIDLAFIFLGLTFMLIDGKYQDRQIAKRVLNINTAYAYKNGLEDGKIEAHLRNEVEKIISVRIAEKKK